MIRFDQFWPDLIRNFCIFRVPISAAIHLKLIKIWFDLEFPFGWIFAFASFPLAFWMKCHFYRLAFTQQIASTGTNFNGANFNSIKIENAIIYFRKMDWMSCVNIGDYCDQLGYHVSVDRQMTLIQRRFIPVLNVLRPTNLLLCKWRQFY